MKLLHSVTAAVAVVYLAGCQGAPSSDLAGGDDAAHALIRSDCEKEPQITETTYRVPANSSCLTKLEGDRPIALSLRGITYSSGDPAANDAAEFSVVVDGKEFTRDRFNQNNARAWIAPGKHEIEVKVGKVDYSDGSIQIEFDADPRNGLVGEPCTTKADVPKRIGSNELVRVTVRGTLVQNSDDIQTDDSQAYSRSCQPNDGDVAQAGREFKGPRSNLERRMTFGMGDEFTVEALENIVIPRRERIYFQDKHTYSEGEWARLGSSREALPWCYINGQTRGAMMPQGRQSKLQVLNRPGEDLQFYLLDDLGRPFFTGKCFRGEQIQNPVITTGDVIDAFAGSFMIWK